MRFLLTVQYVGTAYCGWQRQPNALSVQQVLEEAFFLVTGEKVCMHASGRTDAGVHAKGQRVHFDSQTKIPPEKLPFALNTKLPSDVRVSVATIVPDDFHARYSVKNKTYVYSFYCSPHEDPFMFPFAEHLPLKPDMAKMQATARLIEGEHDFKCFQASGGHVKSTIRTVYSIKITENNEHYEIAVNGNGFLYNMVRIIAGTLYYAGIDRITPSDVKKAFETGDRNLLGKTLEAKGLSLYEVVY